MVRAAAAPNSTIFGRATLSILVRNLPTCRHQRHPAWKIYKGKLPSSGRWEEENVELYSLQSDEKKRGIKAAACNDLLNSSAHTFIRARIWDDRIAGLRIWHPAYSAPLACCHPTPSSSSSSWPTGTFFFSKKQNFQLAQTAEFEGLESSEGF